MMHNQKVGRSFKTQQDAGMEQYNEEVTNAIYE